MRLSLLSLLAVSAGMALPALADEKDDMIKSAESAAPAAVTKDAMIMSIGADGAMTTLREGTNGWWCIPDAPNTPGPDPMCGDANAMEWMKALVGHTDPPAGKVGLAYMLAGGSDADNMDPYATGPAQGGDWVTTGPHIMVINAPDLTTGMPESAKPDTSVPYVMYPGTPYAHLMMPVK